jgi:hypothetical protein
MSKKDNTTLVSGYFLDEKELKGAIKNLKEKNVTIREIFTPFPVHGLDDVMGLKKSRIPTVGFIAGAMGGIGAFVFQSWVFTESYPMNIGGKPLLSIPTFIPIIFETTVLFAAIAMVFAFLFRSKLGLGAENKIYDPRVTDDHFLVLLSSGDSSDTEGLKRALNEVGAQDVKIVE